MKEKVFIGRAGAKLQQADVHHHDVPGFCTEGERVIPNHLTAVRHSHDRTIVRTVAIAKEIAAGEKVAAVGAQGLVFVKTEETAGGVIPEDDAVPPVGHEDHVGRGRKRAKQRRELFMGRR